MSTSRFGRFGFQWTVLVLIAVALLAFAVADARADEGDTPDGPEGPPPTGPLPPEASPVAPPSAGPSETPEAPTVEPPAGAPSSPLSIPVDLSNLAPGRLPDLSGPPLPRAVGQRRTDALRMLARWTVRIESTLGAPNLVGTIVRQDPSPGTPLAPGDTVTLVMAVDRITSPQHKRVPSLEAMDAMAAVAALRDAGFGPVLRGVPSTPEKAGIVRMQRPLSGSLALGGDDVLVLIGVGGLESERPALPESLPLETSPVAPPPAGPSETPEAPPVLPPTVEPPAGTPTSPLSTPVDLSSLAPGQLPDLSGPPLPHAIGRRRADALRMLGRWTVRVESALAAPNLAGTILCQDPGPGTPLAPGETVTLVVAVNRLTSPQHKRVPPLEAMDAATAVAALRDAGFRPVLRSVPSTPEKAGIVRMQRPLSGSLALGEGDVLVHIGIGGLEFEPPALPEPLPPAPPKPQPQIQLGIVTLLSPTTGQTSPKDFGSTFRWTTVSGAKAYEWELQVEARDGSWSTVTTQVVEETRFRPDHLEAGRLRWRIRALQDDVKGDWSPFSRLYVY